MNRLTDSITLTAALLLVGFTVPMLKAWVNKGLVRAVRDDAGRRLLLREDVERIARERVARSERPRKRAR